MHGEDDGSRAQPSSPPMDRFTSFLDRHTSHPKHVKNLKLGIAEIIGLLRSISICVRIPGFAPFIWHY